MPANFQTFNEGAGLHQAEPMRTRCERCDGPVAGDGFHCADALPTPRDEAEIMRRLGLLAIDDPLACLLLLVRPLACLTLEEIAAGLAPITGREISRQALHKKISALADRFPDLRPILTPRREAG